MLYKIQFTNAFSDTIESILLITFAKIHVDSDRQTLFDSKISFLRFVRRCFRASNDASNLLKARLQKEEISDSSKTRRINRGPIDDARKEYVSIAARCLRHD